MSLPLSRIVNHQVRLAARPVGMPTAENWQFTEEAVTEPADGGLLIKVLALSLDPAMRGWMNDARSYIPPVGIGEVMRAGGIGVVIASKNPAFAVGDHVSCGPGVQEYFGIGADEFKRNGLFKIDLGMGTPTQWLNVLGMPGMTGYFGLMDVGQPKAGETVVVSGAAGAVGQTVGQLARIKGCRVVGIAGGPAKCEWVVEELGFDACIDYKAGSVREGLKQMLADAPDIEVCAEATNGPDVLAAVDGLGGPKGLNLVLLDIAMPGRDGLDVLQALRKTWPTLPVLMLSTYPEKQYAVRCIKQGAAGYLNKSADPDDMVAAVRKVAAGGVYVTPATAEALASAVGKATARTGPESLSHREYQVFRLLTSGHSVSEIGAQLSLAPNTVSTYRARILEKTGTK
ncbi:MAG TPA: response regulator, partial [Alicycliphilus sp.]|nr:response regulator [Alicycliphilus sp.]